MILFSRNFVNIEDQHSPLGMEPQQWLEDAEFITFQARIMAKSKRDRMKSQGGKAMSPPPFPKGQQRSKTDSTSLLPNLFFYLSSLNSAPTALWNDKC